MPVWVSTAHAICVGADQNRESGVSESERQPACAAEHVDGARFPRTCGPAPYGVEIARVGRSWRWAKGAVSTRVGTGRRSVESASRCSSRCLRTLGSRSDTRHPSACILRPCPPAIERRLRRLLPLEQQCSRTAAGTRLRSSLFGASFIAEGSASEWTGPQWRDCAAERTSCSPLPELPCSSTVASGTHVQSTGTFQGRTATGGRRSSRSTWPVTDATSKRSSNLGGVWSESGSTSPWTSPPTECALSSRPMCDPEWRASSPETDRTRDLMSHRRVGPTHRTSNEAVKTILKQLGTRARRRPQIPFIRKVTQHTHESETGYRTGYQDEQNQPHWT